MADAFSRIAVVGTSGSGKSRLARTLSDQLRIPHIELDRLKYNPDWSEVCADEFFHRVAEIAGADHWIIDGNYADVQDIIWIRADHLIWLDYPLRFSLGRILKRTLLRLIGREEFGNKNREELGRLLGRKSILLWAIRSHRPLREKYEALIAEPRYSHLSVIRLRSPAETRKWVSEVLNLPFP